MVSAEGPHTLVVSGTDRAGNQANRTATFTIDRTAPAITLGGFTDGALLAIAKEALLRHTGARGLRAILEEIMLDVMYDLPGRENIRECVISEEVVQRKCEPILVYDNEAGWAGAEA